MYSLGVLTKEKFTLDIFCNQLKQIFGDKVHLEGVYLNDAHVNLHPFKSTIILISGRTQLEEGLRTGIISATSNLVISRRTLNLENINALKELFEIPAGSEVLIADNTRHESLELLHDVERLLMNVGIQHITLIPYLSNTTRDTFPTVALTFGMPYLVPGMIEKIVDLGYLQIDVSTVIEIIQKMGYTDEVNYEWFQYVPPIVALTQQVVESALEISNTNSKLSSVIESSSDGILVLNTNHEIVLCNNKLADFLETPISNIANQSLNDVLPEASHIEVDDSDLIRIRSQNFLVSVRTLHPERHLGFVLVVSQINSIREMENIVRKHLYTKEHSARYHFRDIITQSNRMVELKTVAEGMAKTNFDVLINGESGTGKELFAQSIHNASHRCTGPFVAANVAAFPDNLVESELFGYEDGAFTGAKKGGRPGLFEVAHQGTLFLDEIGELSLSVQSKLLRVIQEREIRRVGGTKVIPVDVRIIAATNRDLYKMVKHGEFRSDLFYRLYVLPINIPPLRDRREDVLPLLNHFLHKFNMKTGTFPQSTQRFLSTYPWPGNLRQLENFSYYLGCLSSIHGAHHISQTHVQNYFASIMDSDSLSASPAQLYEKLNTNEDASLLMNILVTIKNISQEGQVNLSLIHHTVGEHVLSRNSLREKMNKLGDLGLVNVGKTRQGTMITRAGIEVVELIGERLVPE